MRSLLRLSVFLFASLGAQAKIVVDGRADEADWAKAQRYTDLVQTQPLSETPIPEKYATEVAEPCSQETIVLLRRDEIVGQRPISGAELLGRRMLLLGKTFEVETLLPVRPTTSCGVR